MANYQPLGNRLLVERSKVAQTKQGIYLPDSAKETPREGTIVAMGKGKLLDDGSVLPLTVQMGDTVIFGAYSGTEVSSEDQDKDLIILSEEDILAVIES